MTKHAPKITEDHMGLLEWRPLERQSRGTSSVWLQSMSAGLSCGLGWTTA